MAFAEVVAARRGGIAGVGAVIANAYKATGSLIGELQITLDKLFLEVVTLGARQDWCIGTDSAYLKRPSVSASDQGPKRNGRISCTSMPLLP